MKRRATMRLSEGVIRREVAGHEARNSTLRDWFREREINLDEERKIECQFWAKSEEDAHALASALVEQGFVVLASQPAVAQDKRRKWNIEVAIRQSIALTLTRAFTERLVRLAARHSAEYDGWGVSV